MSQHELEGLMCSGFFLGEFFLGGGQNFALAASPLAYLFLLASLAKKLKHQGRSQDYFRDCGIKDFKNFSRRQ